MSAESSISRSTLHWDTMAAMIFFHAGALAAVLWWSWQGLLLALFLNWVAGSLGIGMSYHRLLTHRGYKAPKWVEYFLTTCALLALEGGPINWVATHRIHHARSDHEGDPHSPRDGRWWAHMGWLFSGPAMQHDEAVLRRWAPDLMRDPGHRFLNRFYWVPIVLLAAVLYWISGLQMVLWGVFFRVTLGLHSTWLVNSATHLWGSKRFKTTDDSRNNWWVALLTWGEGWHNNHHAHPVSARHGLAWYEIDINWMGIRALQMLGLAKSVKVARIDAEPEDAAEASRTRIPISAEARADAANAA